MRDIKISDITNTIKGLCIKANCYLGDDMKKALELAYENEESETGKSILDKIIENSKIAKQDSIAMCQDTGMAVVFLEIGQDVHFVGGMLEDAINEGVRMGYKEGYFRNSVVEDPIKRENTGDNTPAVIHYQLAKGDKVKIQVVPKGFGSENMSALAMLKPSDGVEGIMKFVIETVEKAGSNPCPPIVVGVGIGGTMEKAAFLAKKSLLRPIDKENSRKDLNELEQQLLENINKLGIGPQGLGGRTTALKVNIQTYATHIAGLPVAVNINCHASRHAEAIL